MYFLAFFVKTDRRIGSVVRRFLARAAASLRLAFRLRRAIIRAIQMIDIYKVVMLTSSLTLLLLKLLNVLHQIAESRV